ncbi:MAG TPA: SDR family oxidoreductase [Candidatus Dormibacteraeota bacterium]|nr:SDR family oxidoreductase [Candidatus Dormibacteraeota bacterium]
MAKDLFRLDDKVAVITGGSRGIGRSIAEEFARRGASVVITARNAEELEETAQAIRDEGGAATGIAAHAAKEETINALVDQVMEKYGRIDILVNNAATNVAFAQLSDLDVSAWDKTLEINLRGPFILSKVVVNRWMKEHGGNIINLCSIAGFRGDPNMGAYSVSKAALVMLTKVQARELGAYGIRVNGIAPAIIKTKFSRILYETEEIRTHAEAQAALGRVGEWDEVAGTAVYLASDASSYVTGSIALVDGGTLA